MSAKAWRDALDQFCRKEMDVEALAERHPRCACEGADSPTGSPGPVKDDEIVRLFLTSRSDIEGKKRAQREKRPFRAKSLQRVFVHGLSVVRLGHATPEEMEHSASLLHDNQSRRDPQHGGLLAVMDFPVEAVRNKRENMCVFETPLEPRGDGSFGRPSHADIVSAVAGLTDEQKMAKRRARRASSAQG